MNKLMTCIAITTTDPDNPVRKVWHETERNASHADDFGWAKDHTQAARQTFEQQGSSDGPIQAGSKTTYIAASGGVITVDLDVTVDPPRPDACMDEHLNDLVSAFAIDAPAT